MSFSNYEDYYKHLVETENHELINPIDVTKFQCHITSPAYIRGIIPNFDRGYSDDCGYIDDYKDYMYSINELHYELIQYFKEEEPIETVSYKTLPSLEETVINSLNFDGIHHIVSGFMFNKDSEEGCRMALHRVYLYQNIPLKDNVKGDELNMNRYHWKNEPKTVVTVYVYLSDVTENDSHISILQHPTTGKCITMPTNRTGTDSWGHNTHLRYKDCQLSDSQVEEFKYYGFQEKHITGKAGTIITLGHNVVHKHNLKSGNNILVLKFRPCGNESRYSSNKPIGGIFDMPVDPSPC